jgi:hypothetical protein
LLSRNANYTRVPENGLTFLHKVAISADIRTIGLLAAAGLRGLDLDARDKKEEQHVKYSSLERESPTTFVKLSTR